jgi:hypothetical protein
MMTFQNQDFALLEEGIQLLSAYLLSNELYWPLKADLPRLTIGGLLLALTRTQVRTVSSAEQAEVSRITSQVDAVRSKWTVAWEAKATRELGSRLNLWKNYLGDIRNASSQYRQDYPNEVRNRVILELLLAELPKQPPEAAALAGLDVSLRKQLDAGDFIWDPELQVAFPQDKFWFLYGNLGI